MERINLDQLHGFATAIELGSFSAAAQRLDLTQPAVSLQVRQLEKRLGTPLVERAGRVLRPTAAGAELLAHVGRIDAAVSDALDAVARHADGTAGCVRLGTGATACIFLLPPVLRSLRQRFAGQGVQVEALALPDPAAPGRFASQRLDTIVALNVVEHIEDHLGALRTMHEMLVPGGRVIILVPALPSIYGTLDTELQHFRRYTRATLAAVIADAGFRLEHLSWFNRVGVFGWWLNARVRKVPRIPLAQLRMFDAIVPLLTAERFVPLPFGQSLVAVGRRDG